MILYPLTVGNASVLLMKVGYAVVTKMEMLHVLILLTMLPSTLGCIRDPLDKDAPCLTTKPPVVIPSETSPPTDHITIQTPYDQTKPGNVGNFHLTDPKLYLLSLIIIPIVGAVVHLIKRSSCSMSVDSENDPRNLQTHPPARLKFDPMPLPDMLGGNNLPRSTSTFDVTGTRKRLMIE